MSYDIHLRAFIFLHQWHLTLTITATYRPLATHYKIPKWPFPDYPFHNESLLFLLNSIAKHFLITSLNTYLIITQVYSITIIIIRVDRTNYTRSRFLLVPYDDVSVADLNSRLSDSENGVCSVTNRWNIVKTWCFRQNNRFRCRDDWCSAGVGTARATDLAIHKKKAKINVDLITSSV